MNHGATVDLADHQKHLMVYPMVYCNYQTPKVANPDSVAKLQTNVKDLSWW